MIELRYMVLSVFSLGEEKVVTESFYLNGITHFLFRGGKFGFEFLSPLF